MNAHIRFNNNIDNLHENNEGQLPLKKSKNGHKISRHSRTIRGFIDKQISRWIERQKLDEKHKLPDYSVTLSREGIGHLFHCHMEIYLGSMKWIGTDYGMGLHDSLLRCMARLHLQDFNRST